MLGLFVSLAIAPFPQTNLETRLEKTIVLRVDFQHADAREALKKLFREHLFGVTIAPDVQGTITLSLRNVSFEAALQNVTRQVDATYRIDHGWFEIVRRQDVSLVPPYEPDPEYVSIETAYGTFKNAVAAGKGGELRRLLEPSFEARNATETKRGEPAVRSLIDTVRTYPRSQVEHVVRWRVAPSPSAEIVVGYPRPGAPTLYYRDFWKKTGRDWRLAVREETVLNPTLRFENAPLAEVLKALARDTDFAWAVEPNWNRRITVDLTRLPFEAALRRIMEAAGATYRIEGGVYHFLPQT